MTRAVSFSKPGSEHDRFERHHSIEGWSQERLARARLLVFGAGALGNEVIKNLALIGVGHLTIVDMDRIEVSNLSRSVLFRDSDERCSKAQRAALAARTLNPKLSTLAIEGDLHHQVGPGLAETHDLAIACLDSVDARLGAHRICRSAKIPLWNGGLGPHAAEVTRFDFDTGACYACTLGSRTRARESRRWSCQDGTWQALSPSSLPTTISSAALGGALLTHEALASLMPGLESRCLNKSERLMIEALPPRLTRFSIARDPECLEHGVSDIPLIRSNQDRSVAGHRILEDAGADSSTEVHFGFDLVTEASCHCPPAAEIAIPARLFLPRCEQCGVPKTGVKTSAALLARHAALMHPLAQVGVADGGEILLNDRLGLRRVRLRSRFIETQP